MQPERKIPSNFREHWTKFCRTTGIPGLRHIVDQSQPLWIRRFWFIVIHTCFVILVSVVCCRSVEIFTRLRVYSSLTMVDNHSLVYPDIHICDPSFFSRNRLLEMGFNDTMGSYLIASQTQLLATHYFRLDKERNVRMSNTLDELLIPLGGDIFSNVSMKAALTCEEILVGCAHGTKLYNSSECCSKFFLGAKTYLIPYGSCITTTNQQLDEKFAYNLDRGITFLVRMNVGDRIELDPTILSPGLLEKVGMIYSASHPSAPNYFTLLFGAKYITPGTKAEVELSVTKSDHSAMKGSMFAPYDCALEDEFPDLVRGFPFYSKAHCELSSIQVSYNEWFGCNVMSVPVFNYTLPYCLPRHFAFRGTVGLGELIKSRQNECPKDCVSVSYDMKIHTTELASSLKPSIMSKFGIDPVEVRHMVCIHFYFPSLNYASIAHQPEQFLHWLGVLGENLGLYMGASLLSFVELLTFLYRYTFLMV